MNWLKKLLSRPTVPSSTGNGDEEREPIVLPQGESPSYAPDRPIKARSEDRFQRWGFAKRIADTIARREDPRGVVVGIFGAWGEGKTSVLNLIDEALREYEEVITVQFNPWYFTSEAVLLKALFSTLAQGIGEKLPTIAERLGQALEKWGQVLALASGSMAGGAITVSPGEPLAKLGATLAETSLETLRNRIQGLLRETKKRVVVLIDDIDRLDRSEIQALFKAVRLSGDFDYVTYVLALDERIVSASLAERYPTGHERAGKDFLEKIIQVPLHLPPADGLALRMLVFEGIEEALKVAGVELSQHDIQTLVLNFVRGFEPTLTTPRQARRYANALLFSLPLLKGEVHVPDQLLIEGIHVFYPTLYEIIRTHPEAFLGGLHGTIDEPTRRLQRDLFATGLEGFPDATKKAMERILERLFPRFRNAGYGAEWEASWVKEKRICSKHYFSRYFSYAVPAGDISDIVFDQFLASVKSDSTSVEQLWRDIATQSNAARIVERLRNRVSELSSGVAAALSLAIAHTASILPRESGPFLYLSTFSQAGILIYHLTSILPEAERRNHAERLLRDAEPLSFAIECLRWLWNPDEKEDYRILTREEGEYLSQLVANRIKNYAALHWLVGEFGKDTPSLLWIWRNFGEDGATQTRDYLERSFSEQPRRVPEFLAAFTGQAWGLESGLPAPAIFFRNHYDEIVKYVPSEVIRMHLEVLYGTQLHAPTDLLSGDMPDDLLLARHFLSIDDHAHENSGEISR